MDTRAYGVCLLGPLCIAGNPAVLEVAVDVEFQIIGVLFARYLPVELERLGAARIDYRLEDGYAVLVGIAALGRVGVVIAGVLGAALRIVIYFVAFISSIVYRS